jgi:hypothetical protein
LWHRLETQGNLPPIFVGVGYFPQDHGHKQGLEELTTVAKTLVKQGSIIFGGDLNARTGSNGDTVTNARGVNLQNTLHTLGMELVNKLSTRCTDKFTRIEPYGLGLRKSTISYVACTRDIVDRVSKLAFHPDQMGSDHKPLVLSINLAVTTGSRPSLRTVWSTDNIVSPPRDWSWVNACRSVFTDWISKTGHLTQALDALGAENSRIADILDWSFQLELDRISALKLGFKTQGNQRTSRVPTAIKLLNDQRLACEDALKHAMNDPSSSASQRGTAKANFLAARRAVTSAGRRLKTLKEATMFADIEANQGNSKLFWQRVKSLRASTESSKTPPPIVDNGIGGVEDDPLEVLRIWKDYYASMAKVDLTDTREEGRYDDAYMLEVEEDLNRRRLVRLTQPHLDRPMTEDEVFRALRALNAASAPGEDGVLASILRSAADAVNNNTLREGNSVVSALTLMFNFLLDRETWPSRWRTGIIMPLYKKDARTDPMNYRPITLLSIVGKLFAKVLCSRLAGLAESEASDLLADEQGGFRSHRGSLDQVLTLREIIRSRKDRGQATYATFIDIRKAYDTVWREALYTTLHSKGVKGKIWRQLQVMHGQLSRKVKLPSGTSDSFPVGRGVAQGAVESPLLYAIFINGLIDELKSLGFGVQHHGTSTPILLYADDIVLLASNHYQLARMHKAVSSFAERMRFEINGSKSGVMAFHASAATRRLMSQKKWSVFGEEVEFVPSYVYLGVTLTPDIECWKLHVENLIEVATKRSSWLVWLCKNPEGLQPRSAVTLWRALVRPLLEYGCELFAGELPADLLRRVEKVQSDFAKSVLDLRPSRSAPSAFALSELGMGTMSARWAKLRLGFWRRVQVADSNRLLVRVVRARAAALGENNYVTDTYAIMSSYNLDPLYWGGLPPNLLPSKKAWSTLVDIAVDRVDSANRTRSLSDLHSLQAYLSIKSWSRTTPLSVCSRSEEGRLGFRVCEPYLADRTRKFAALIKARCRGGCLNTLDRMVRHGNGRWPGTWSACCLCPAGSRETILHIIILCSAYNEARAKLFSRVCNALALRSISKTFCHDGVPFVSGAPLWDNFCALPDGDKLAILLGRSLSDPVVERKIDKAIKQFLTCVWKTRGWLTSYVNHLSYSRR